MGWGGRRIKQITLDTGCCIIVRRIRPPGESVPIDIYAEHQKELSEAVRLITECFKEDEDEQGLDSDIDTDTDEDDESASASASDSDVEDSSAVSSDSALARPNTPSIVEKPRHRPGLKETYVVPSELVRFPCASNLCFHQHLLTHLVRKDTSC